jgi:hypothetical protein
MNTFIEYTRVFDMNKIYRMAILSFEVSQNFLNSRVFNGGSGCSKVITFVLDLETKDIKIF